MDVLRRTLSGRRGFRRRTASNTLEIESPDLSYYRPRRLSLRHGTGDRARSDPLGFLAYCRIRSVRSPARTPAQQLRRPILLAGGTDPQRRSGRVRGTGERLRILAVVPAGDRVGLPGTVARHCACFGRK